jgi:hypothetical protein
VWPQGWPRDGTALSPAVALHSLLAILILAALGIGYFSSRRRRTASRASSTSCSYTWRGMFIVGLMVVRFLVRWRTARPPSLTPVSRCPQLSENSLGQQKFAFNRENRCFSLPLTIRILLPLTLGIYPLPELRPGLSDRESRSSLQTISTSLSLSCSKALCGVGAGPIDHRRPSPRRFACRGEKMTRRIRLQRA